MKKILAIVATAALVSAYYGVGAEDVQTTGKNETAKTGRIFVDAKTEDGRIDLGVILTSPCIVKERKEVFAAADLDHDGYLTQEEYNAVFPDAFEEEIKNELRSQGLAEMEHNVERAGLAVVADILPFGAQYATPPFLPGFGEHRLNQPLWVSPLAPLAAFKTTR